jgi:hypothetical protein
LNDLTHETQARERLEALDGRVPTLLVSASLRVPGLTVRVGAVSYPLDASTQSIPVDPGQKSASTRRASPAFSRPAGPPAQLRIPVATCATTLANQKEVPAGPFWRPRGDGSRDHDSLVELPTFRIELAHSTSVVAAAPRFSAGARTLYPVDHQPELSPRLEELGWACGER